MNRKDEDRFEMILHSERGIYVASDIGIKHSDCPSFSKDLKDFRRAPPTGELYRYSKSKPIFDQGKEVRQYLEMFNNEYKNSEKVLLRQIKPRDISLEKRHLRQAGAEIIDSKNHLIKNNKENSPKANISQDVSYNLLYHEWEKSKEIPNKLDFEKEYRIKSASRERPIDRAEERRKQEAYARELRAQIEEKQLNRKLGLAGLPPRPHIKNDSEKISQPEQYRLENLDDRSLNGNSGGNILHKDICLTPSLAKHSKELQNYWKDELTHPFEENKKITSNERNLYSEQLLLQKKKVYPKYPLYQVSPDNPMIVQNEVANPKAVVPKFFSKESKFDEFYKDIPENSSEDPSLICLTKFVEIPKEQIATKIEMKPEKIISDRIKKPDPGEAQENSIPQTSEQLRKLHNCEERLPVRNPNYDPYKDLDTIIAKDEKSQDDPKESPKRKPCAKRQPLKRKSKRQLLEKKSETSVPQPQPQPQPKLETEKIPKELPSSERTIINPVKKDKKPSHNFESMGKIVEEVQKCIAEASEAINFSPRPPRFERKKSLKNDNSQV